LESKEEYQELKYKKIPSIEHEIKLFETQGKLISSAQDELSRLKEQEIDIKDSIDKLNKTIGILSDTLEFKEDLIGKLEKFYEKKIDYESLYSEMEKCYDDIKKIQTLMKELNAYKEKLKEKKKKLSDIEQKLNPLTKQREYYKMEQLKILDHKQEMASIEEDMYKCSIIRDSLSVKDDGIPVDVLEFFMDTVRQNANTLLSNTFNGALYLEEFEIDQKNFCIPYKKNGDRGMDVSFASSSERSFISLCLTLAIMEEIISTYGILILDEIDRGFSDHNKYKFIQILGNQIRRVGITQTFMTTHNREYYEGFDLGYILFPGHSLTKYDDDDVIKVYE
jgi:DNA repair exonuclease SbcCD ATPase subunit